jgi:hypothetical protein
MSKGITEYAEMLSIEFAATGEILNPTTAELEIGAALLNLVRAMPNETRHRIITSEGGWDCNYNADEDYWVALKMYGKRAMYDFTLRR